MEQNSSLLESGSLSRVFYFNVISIFQLVLYHLAFKNERTGITIVLELHKCIFFK